jgi:hypothetical protein
MTARHKSFSACIKKYADKCNEYKKNHVRHGRYSKAEKVKRNKAKAKRERIIAKRDANGRKDFIRRPYNKKMHPDLQAVIDANP